MPPVFVSYSATYGGKPLTRSSTTFAHDPAAELRIFDAAMQGVHIDRNYIEPRDVRNDDGQGFNAGTFDKPGTYLIQVGDSLPPHDVGFSGYKFTLTLTAPKPSTPPVVTKPTPPVITPPAEKVQRIAGAKLAESFDGGGASFVHAPTDHYTPAFWLDHDGTKLANLTLKSVPRPDPTMPNPWSPGIVLSGKGCTVDGVKFADDSGFCIKVNGDRSTIRNLTLGTFTDYGVYFEYATNLTIDGVKCVGGSTCESIIRFDECTGDVRNVHLDYTTDTRKACFRGSFIGTITDSTFLGGIVGINPLGGMDGGQCYGWTKFLTSKGIASAVNVDECRIAVKAAMAHGVKDHATLCAAAVGVARDAAGKPIPVDIAATVARRKLELAKRSDYTATNVICGAGLRWEAGTTARYIGGEVHADASGNVFPNIATVYPEPDWVLPGDTPRTFPDIQFAGTKFTGPLSLSAFLTLAKASGAKLDAACTYNGKAVA